MSDKKEIQDQAVFNDRVHFLLDIEKLFNEKWENDHLYEVDAPKGVPNTNHYLITFPFPYMNGRLHLGHLFTFTKSEFSVRYERMKGKTALFPFGFHCTGMPIKASADKLKLELSTGQALITDGSHLKSKAASKIDTSKSQFEIMKMSGVPEAEIPEFVNPEKWLKYFPPLGMADLKVFGSAIDWRRSFITTDHNPYFDHFVRWQFSILYRKGLVQFGKRPTIYSLRDQQPCMDHDRSTGEGVQPQEYTLIKLQLVNPAEVSDKFPPNVPVFLLAATLRPETMIAQSNYWIKPGEKYDVVFNKAGTEIFVAGHHCVMNLFAQDFVQSLEPIFELEAEALLGKEVKSSTIKSSIRGFPMTSILMNKGTGIVTSVASDAPADYAALQDLKLNDKFREKYGIKKEWLEFDIEEIIHTETYGNMAAIETLKILNYDFNEKNPKIKEEKLAQAKDMAYKEGFYKGIMISGPYKGEKVSIAKEKAKVDMVAANEALVYYEPESEVISRSGDECVVVCCDQWYLLYGKEDWKQKVVEHFNKSINCYHSETKEKFLKCFDWLGPWACSRSYGLGTHLPFDEKYIIESLSDSTIYTAYYTISHLLQGDIEGSKPGLLNITPDQCTNEFFDAVFLNGPIPENIEPEKMEKLRQEFNFFYPCNCRVSGKDLVTNHLTMYQYNHAAIFPEDKWPIGIRANGHLKLNNRKMSKHDGNFYTVIEAIEKYSSSVIRIALADAGDGVDDANFSEEVARSISARLFNFIDLVKQMKSGTLPFSIREEKSTFADDLFDAKLSKTIIGVDEAYGQMMYKAALKLGFYDLFNSWTYYLHQSENSVCKSLMERYIDTFLKLLTPIAPHYTDYVWRELLNHETTIVNEKFPTPNQFDPKIFFMDRFLSKTIDQIRYKLKTLSKKLNCTEVAIFIKNQYSPTHIAVLDLLQRSFNKEKNSFDWDDIKTKISEDPVLSKLNPGNYMPELKFLVDAVPEFGAFLLDHEPGFSQVDLIRLNEKTILRQLHLQKLHIITEPIESPLFDEKIFNDSKVFQATANLTGPAKQGGKKK